MGRKNFIFYWHGIIFCLRMPVKPEMNGPLARACRHPQTEYRAVRGKEINDKECRPDILDFCILVLR